MRRLTARITSKVRRAAGIVCVAGTHGHAATFPERIRVATYYEPGERQDCPLYPRGISAVARNAYVFEGWRPHPELASYQLTQQVVTLGVPEGPSTFHAVFAPKEEYTLKLEVRAQGGGSAKCAGYVNAWPARKYYEAGEHVKLKAEPNFLGVSDQRTTTDCAYVFLRWEGNAGVPWGSSLVPIKDVYSDSPTIEMNHDTTVTAVFLDLTSVSTFGEQVYYMTPWSWTSEPAYAYAGDQFDHRVTARAPAPGWDWEGVEVREQIYVIDNPFGCTIEPHAGEGGQPGTWLMSHDNDRTDQWDAVLAFTNCSDFAPKENGFWRFPNSAEPTRFLDAHRIVPYDYPEIKAHFLPDPGATEEVKAVQVMRISGVGPNNQDLGYAQGCLYAAHALTFKFVDAVGGCYNASEQAAHCLVSKGGQKHPCAWDEIPDVFPSTAHYDPATGRWEPPCKTLVCVPCN